MMAAGPIAGATGASYTATASGDYYAIITNTTGCSSTTNISHAVEIAAPFIEASGPASFCAGGDVVLYTSTGTGTGITYQWQKDSVNIAGATSSSYVVNTSGYYSCLCHLNRELFLRYKRNIH